MSEEQEVRLTAFEGHRRIASGTRAEVARAAARALQACEPGSVLVFDDRGQLVELDLRGSLADVERRYPTTTSASGCGDPTPEATEIDEKPRRGPGRPKLGVVGKEVTLLPRHWAWLGAQRGGASVTLRKLVEQARRETAQADQTRQAQDRTYRFMLAMVGDAPGFEEATRALYAGDEARFHAEAAGWPGDLRDHVARMADGAFSVPSSDRPQGKGE